MIKTEDIRDNNLNETTHKELDGNIHIIDNYKYFETYDIIDYNTQKLSCSDVLYTLVKKNVDIITQKVINYNMRIVNCKIDENKYILNYRIIRYADAIKIEELIIPESYDGDIRIIIEKYDVWTNKLLLEYEYEKSEKSKYGMKIPIITCNYSENIILKIIINKTDNSEEIINKIDNLEEIAKSIKMNVKHYFVNQDLRRSMNDVIINKIIY